MISTKVQDLVLTAIAMEQTSITSLDAYFKHNQLFVTNPQQVNKVRRLVQQLNVNVAVVSIDEEMYA